jgi:hypothetical protein
MTRALIAVGAALALLLGGLGLVVYVSRDEGNVQVDQVLSEEFTRVVAATGPREELRLADVAPFAWDTVLIVAPGTPKETISRRLGYEWRGTIGFQAGDELILLSRGKVARFLDYRGDGHFAGVRRPIAALSRTQAVFRVRDLVITPKG